MAEPGTISVEECRRQVDLVCRRLGLLHLAFADILIREHGEAKGKKLVARAVKEYSRMIGEDKRQKALAQGLPLTPETMTKFRDIPTIGMHDRAESAEVNGVKRRRAYGCVMARVWHEHGKDDIGRIYCYVDPASAMYFNPHFKIAHTAAEPDGDPFCELVNRPTTEHERQDFLKEDTDWETLDK